jgi:hypothetical protein
MEPGMFSSGQLCWGKDKQNGCVLENQANYGSRSHAIGSANGGLGSGERGLFADAVASGSGITSGNPRKQVANPAFPG